MRNFIIIASAVALMTPMFVMTASPAEAKREYREWQGKDGRTYCRKSNGTVGLIVGGAAGGLAGRAIDTRGERTTGTILGIAGGALLGRELDRKRRCR
jgi:uncharacterized protein YcfJ